MQCTHLLIELHYYWDLQMKHLRKLGHGAFITLSPACLEYVISYLASHFTAVTFFIMVFFQKKKDLTTIQPQVAPSSWSLSLPAVHLLVLMN